MVVDGDGEQLPFLVPAAGITPELRYEVVAGLVHVGVHRRRAELGSGGTQRIVGIGPGLRRVVDGRLGPSFAVAGRGGDALLGGECTLGVDDREPSQRHPDPG